MNLDWRAMRGYTERQGDFLRQVVLIYRPNQPVQVDWTTKRRLMYEGMGMSAEALTVAQWEARCEQRRQERKLNISSP